MLCRSSVPCLSSHHASVCHLIRCVGVGPFVQHDETHGCALISFLTHQLEHVRPLCRHVVDVRQAPQRHLQAAAVTLGGANTVEQHT